MTGKDRRRRITDYLSFRDHFNGDDGSPTCWNWLTMDMLALQEMIGDGHCTNKDRSRYVKWLQIIWVASEFDRKYKRRETVSTSADRDARRRAESMTVENQEVRNFFKNNTHCSHCNSQIRRSLTTEYQEHNAVMFVDIVRDMNAMNIETRLKFDTISFMNSFIWRLSWWGWYTHYCYVNVEEGQLYVNWGRKNLLWVNMTSSP